MPRPAHPIIQHIHPAVLGGIAVVVLTGAIGQRFYNQPQLAIGSIAPQTVIAPADASVENTKLTEEKQKAARREVKTLLMLDDQSQASTQQDLKRLFDQATQIRKIAGPFPYFDRGILSEFVQRYLRQTSDQEWQQFQAQILNPRSFANQAAAKAPSNTAKANAKSPQAIAANPLYKKSIAEMRRYLKTQPPNTMAMMLQKIQQSRQFYQAALAAIDDPAFSDPGVHFDPKLLVLSDRAWQQTQTAVLQIADRMLAQGIAPGLPQGVLDRAIQMQVQGSVPPESQDLAVDLLKAVLRPNLVPDPERTQVEAEKAAQEIPPQMVKVRRGEPIVRAGTPIQPAQFLLLEYFGLSERRTNWEGLLGLGCGVAVTVGVFIRLAPRLTNAWRKRDYGLVWMLALTTPLLIALWMPAINLPLIGLLMSTFYGPSIALLTTASLGGLLPVGMDLSLGQWLPSFLGGLLAAGVAGRLRSREEQAFLGLMVGLLQGVIYGVLGLLSGGVSYGLLIDTGLQGLRGLAWSIAAIGLSPYLEQIFDLAPTIRLLELANSNRPLLKRLAAETPGTFQHTLFVANLAEAAARELGCNVELVRTGTLYHDIGKMHDPMGFIENQMGAVNKHDLINDPWESAAIIRKHVTEGLVMARKARLPKAVQAFIPEHQGTMFIVYFHHRAQQRAAEDPSQAVRDEDFRYPGPKPQSRETGIVMVADSCEAALRSLKDATPEVANNMIQKIVRSRWQDGQLSESGLSREDLGRIAEVFLRVWQQSNHQRIAYPK